MQLDFKELISLHIIYFNILFHRLNIHGFGDKHTIFTYIGDLNQISRE